MKMENERITKLIARFKENRSERKGSWHENLKYVKHRRDTEQNILENLLKSSPNSYGEFERQCERHHRRGARQPRCGCFLITRKSLTVLTSMPENILVTEEEIREAYEKVDRKTAYRDPQGAGKYPQIS